HVLAENLGAFQVAALDRVRPEGGREPLIDLNSGLDLKTGVVERNVQSSCPRKERNSPDRPLPGGPSPGGNGRPEAVGPVRADPGPKRPAQLRERSRLSC